MGDQEKKRPLLIMFDEISDDDDFTDFTPPTKKVKENASISSSLSSSSENKHNSSINGNRSNGKLNQKKSHRDRDKERNSSNSSSKKDKDKDKHRSSSREKERSISSSSKERERERHKSKSKEKERNTKSTSKDRETEKHISSSKDKEKHNSSRKDNRDKKSTSKDRETENYNGSSKDKERDKRKKSVDIENEKERSTSVNRENEKSKSDCDFDSKGIIKIEEKNINSSKERSPDRNQGSNKDKSQDKCKEASNNIEESVVNCNSIEKNGNTEENSVIKVCLEDIKFNKSIFNDMASKSSKEGKVFNSIPVSIGPLTSTQKSTPERRKPKERISVEEKVFQRELEAVLNISKMDVTAETESLKLEENEAKNEKSIDHGKKSSNEVESEEMKVPKLILKVKTEQMINKIIDKNEINNDNKKDCEPKTSLKEDKEDLPVYEIKKDESCQEFKPENKDMQNINDEETKIDSDSISNTTKDAETHSVENVSASNEIKPLSKDAKIKSDNIDLMYENPKPSTSTGFISGKRQRKTVAFKEESDSEDDDFSVQSDSEDSNFEISPIKQSKDESKTSNSKPDKKGTKKIIIKGNKSNNRKETPIKLNPEKEKTKRISPRTRRNRNSMIVDSDSDSEEFKNSTVDTLKSNKVEHDMSGDTKDDMKENDNSNGKSPATDRNKPHQVKRSQIFLNDDNDESDEDFEYKSDDSEFKPSPKKKSKQTSKEKKNKTLVEKKESNNEKSKMVLNTKNLPTNTDKAKLVLNTTSEHSTKLMNTNKIADTTPIRNIGMAKSEAPVKSFTPVITKPGLSSTPARVSTGLVKTPFRSPLLNTSPNTSNSILRSTTPEVRSIGLRIGLSRSAGFKPLHPNLRK